MLRKFPLSLLIRYGAAIGMLSCVATSSAATNASYPDRAITLVSPWPPGGSNDTISRLLATKLAPALGHPVVVENRPGATGTLGVGQVARAPADGYTIVMGSSPTHATAPSIYPSLPYDPVKDFSPITLIGTSPNVLAVRAGLPASDVKELIALAKASPGKLTFSSAGNGSSQHLSAELFSVMSDVQLLHVPYKGAAPAIADMLAGHVDIGFHNMVDVLPHLKAGTLRALAVTSSQRSKRLPDVPTVDEAGVPGYSAEVWFGLFAPGGTPAPVLQRLHDEVSKALQDDEIRARLDSFGTEVSGIGPEPFTRYVSDEVKKWSDIVRRADVKPN